MRTRVYQVFHDSGTLETDKTEKPIRRTNEKKSLGIHSPLKIVGIAVTELRNERKLYVKRITRRIIKEHEAQTRHYHSTTTMPNEFRGRVH